MEVNAAVIRDVNQTFFSASTDEFLNKILPVPDTMIKDIYKTLTEAGDFEEGRWTDIPPEEANENQYYLFLTNLANKIMEKVKTDLDQKSRVVGIWVDRHNKKPSSADPKMMADSRPDCMLITGSPDIKRVNENVQMKEEDLNEEEKARELSVWWRHVHIPVEIKRDTKVEDWESAYLQLSHYMRHIFAEQVDRRSLLGIVLCKNQMAVVACDRSGLTRTFKPINIHTEAMKFIQVIASFTYMPAHRIGWDPSMDIYDPKTDQHWPSYDVRVPRDVVEQSKYTTHWCITIPNPTNGEEEVMLTIKTLSAISSEVMVGRATLVWEAIKYENRRIDKSEIDKIDIYVIKRYWRPVGKDESPPSNNISIPPEANRYNCLDDKDDRLYSAGDLFIDGQLDSTETHIRQGLKRIADLPRHLSKSQNKADYAREDSVSAEPTAFKATVSSPPRSGTFKPPNEDDYIPRVHTQIIMPFTGGRLREFKSRLELVEVILAAVRDHEMFYRKGIVHRDVSIGNIVIIPKNSTVKGRLIDLDHAKVGTVTTITAVDASEDDIQYLTVVSKLKKTSALYHVDEDVIRLAAQTNLMDSERTIYIEHVLAMRQEFFDSIKPGQPITLADMGWDKENHVLLDFSRRVLGSGGRTGTLPYMSAEVLGAQRFGGSLVPADEPFFHDAVHDMESFMAFMWVIANLFMTRQGPGINALRDELRSGSTKADVNPFEVTLKDALHSIFESPDMRELQEKKTSFVTNPKLMKSEVVDHFHPFFKSFGPMVLRWWNVLVIAYKFREHEYRNIHAHVIDILEKTIDDLKKPTTSEDEEKEREIERAAEEEEEERREKSRSEALHLFLIPPPAQSEARVLRPRVR